MNYLNGTLLTARKICMTIGAALFLVLGVHMVTTAGTPQAAHLTHDVQPEVHQSIVIAR